MFVNREQTSRNEFPKPRPNILRKTSKSPPSKGTVERCSESQSTTNTGNCLQKILDKDLHQEIIRLKCNIPVTSDVEPTECPEQLDPEILELAPETVNCNLLSNNSTVNSDSELCNVIQVSDDNLQNEILSTSELVCPVTPVPNITIEYITSSTMSFKCDVAGCNRKFRNADKYKKHKAEHNMDGSVKVVKQAVSECPVRKNDASGVEVKCNRTFLLKEDLMKHLNDDHKPEDAAFVCWECGRRFFSASGLRAHGRAHGARGARGAGGAGALACAWPGCGRAFRHPCRLREHARAHTGDRPYPCRYPNCGWSFRSASKLLRHARRHTNERSHACAACGRAFLRREHLREHAARHARIAPVAAAAAAVCPGPGCQRTFMNASSLKTHLRKVHRDETSGGADAAIAIPSKKSQEKFVVSIEAPVLHPETAAEETTTFTVSTDEVDISDMTTELGLDADAEWHAARTHCTWPLKQRPEAVFNVATEAEYVMEEDVQVELSEGTESNIYTIRSDLFLHGNVLNNEDSEQMAATAQGAGLGDMGLLDAHPTVGLMQEEMLYTDDAAVDESSFRVFLLSGEDIQIV